MRAVLTGALSFISAAFFLSTASLALDEAIAPAGDVNQPAILSSANVVLTETNSILRASGRLSISDVDSPPRFVAQKNVAGAHGIFNISTAGAWTYVAKSAYNELNAGQSVSDSFSVSSADGTQTAVQVTINGTNDPAILGAPSISLKETNEPLKASGKVSIRDVDSPETFVEQSNVKGKNGTFSIDSGGAWTYDANSAFDELNAGRSVSESFPVSSSDGTKTSVKVTINGTNDAAILSSANVVLTETNEPQSTGGTLSIRDVDNPESFVAKKNVKGNYGTFTIDSAGAWTYATNGALDKISEGQIVSDSFPVSSSDGTKTTVQVTIIGTNDPAILSSPSISLKESNEPLKVSGKVSIRDVDSPETFAAQSNVKGNNGTFSIDTSGRWTYVANSAFDEMNVGQSVSDSFPVSSSDGTKTTVQVTINGTNDPAVLGAPGVSLKETNEPLKASGKVSIRDVDSPETFVEQSNVEGKTGTFSIDSGGAWTYVANSAFDELNEGRSVSDSFAVSSTDGTKTTVKVTINGTNDAAILSSAAVSLDETNTPLSTTGTLTISDVDNPLTFKANNKIAGEYGTLSIDSKGRWKYVANNALDKLNVGQNVSDSFTVSSSDGTKTTVQVTINGTNDPAILGAPSVSLKETNEPLKASGKVSIRDVDSPETFVAQSNVKGKNGTFSIDSAGAWSYIANSAFDEMNVGQSVSDSFSVSSADGTQTSVQVTINGTNDAAILSFANVVLTETNELQSTSGTLSIRDVDSPETFVEQSNVKGKTGTFSIDSAGAWSYVANSAFDELNEGRSVSDSFAVSSTDGTKTTVKVTINGTNDAAILSSAAVSLDETNTPLSATGTLTISDVDNPQTFIAKKQIAGVYGTLSIDSKGRWKYVANSAFDEMNIGQSVSDSFTVSSSDGTTTSVQVTINGTNDPAVLGAPSVSLKETNEPLKASGKVSIRDVDSPETFVAQSNVKGNNGTFSIDSAGAWSYVANSAFDELNVGRSVSDSFAVFSADGTQTTVQVTINGTNDPAILGSAAVVLDETNEPLKPTGTLSIHDVDSPETFVAQSNVKGKNGTFSIDSAGAWSYVANSAFDELNVGRSVSDSFAVFSADGTQTTVQVTINGTNDPAILGSAAVVLDETNEPLKPTGTLSIHDVDSPETFVAQSNVKGKNGNFSIDISGRWTYVANSAFDEMNVGQSISDSFTVSSSDGTPTSVQVTINGTNDPAILGSAAVVLDETNEPLKPTGTLSIHDVDSPETFVAQSNVKGNNGNFSIDISGRWTYVANSAFDELNVGQSISDSFTVSSSDGTPTSVQVTINGTNDPAILGSAAVVLDETNEPLKPTGTLSIHDVDSPETFVAQSNVKGKNGTFSIDSAGAWSYVANSAFDELNVGRSVSDSFIVSSSDGTTTTVQVTINGTNDPAVMGDLRASLTETNEALRASGKVSISDVDSPATLAAQRNVRGNNGTFSIDSGGAWTYLANSAFDRLNVDQSISDSFKIVSADGTPATMQVIINGSNDPAILSAPNVTLRETNSPRKTGGRVDIIDVDSPMSFVALSNVKGKYGTFNIDTSGRWTYVANSAFDELDEGQSVSDRFMVISKDGTATSVQITIEGRDESRFDSGWISGRAGINRSSLNGLEVRDASFYGIEEGTTWKVGVLQLGIYVSMEFNNAASGPVSYNSTVIGMGSKLGFPAGRWQPYGKLGFARTNGNEAADAIGAGHIYRALGMEYKITDSWSIAGEYSISNGDTIVQGVANTLRNKNLSVGLNFYFGKAIPKAPPKAPPIAPALAVAPQPEPPQFIPEPEPAPPIPEVWRTLMEDKPVRIEGTNFASGSAKLNLVAGKELMNDVVEFMGKHPDSNLEVIGYSDSTGSETMNKKLSLARAKSIKKYLVASGIAADRITTKGEGIANPVGDNKTAEGRAKNRRVEIHSVIKQEKKVRVTQPAPTPAPPVPAPAPAVPAPAPVVPAPAPAVPAPAFEPAFGPAPAPVPEPAVPAPAFEPAFGPVPVPAPVPGSEPAR